MPFAGHEDFDACTREHSDKEDPEAYCAAIMRAVEGESAAWSALTPERKTAVLKRHFEEVLGAGYETGTSPASLGRMVNEALDLEERLEAGGKSVSVAEGKQAPLVPEPLQDVDTEDPPEEFADALEAEDFVIYGKASIEKPDVEGEVLDMDALEDALDRFLDSEEAPGAVTLMHHDIPVGRPLREHTVEEDTAIEVGGDAFEIKADETITAHVEDADGDGRPELWLPSNIANDTELARKTRLGVLLGELDGYSVTFGRKEVSTDPDGTRRTTDLDLFAVTLGPDEIIANKGSEFDLAGFKQRMDRAVPRTGGDDAVNGSAEHAVTAVEGALERAFGRLGGDHMSTTDDIDEDALLERLGQRLSPSSDDDTDDEQSGEKTEGGDGDGPENAPDSGEKADARDDLVAALAEELEADEETVAEALDDAGLMADDMPPDGDDEDEEDDDEDTDVIVENLDEKLEAAVEQKLEDRLEGVVREDDLDEKLAAERERIVDDVGEKVAESQEEAIEEIGSKMAAGETPSPAGGSNHEGADLEDELDEITSGDGW